MQQRYYDPLIGQHFLSVDPVTAYSPGGAFNQYWYANANPYRMVDPDGRDPGESEEERRRANEQAAQKAYEEWRRQQAQIANAMLRYTSAHGGSKSQAQAAVTVPQAPPGVNVDTNIGTATKVRNVSTFVGGFSGIAITYVTFYELVRNGGPWDYKQSGRQYEEFGNFNYGAAGSAMGIPREVLLRGAGWAQTRAGTSLPEWGSPLGSQPFGDDPQDQEWIQNGIDYYESTK